MRGHNAPMVTVTQDPFLSVNGRVITLTISVKMKGPLRKGTHSSFRDLYSGFT